MTARSLLLDEDASELERDLYDAMRPSPGAAARTLVRAAAGGRAATCILARLKAAGLLLDAHAIAWMHALWGLTALLAGAGALSVLGHLGDDRIVPTLVSALGAIVAAAACLLWWIHSHRSGASAAGRRLVDAIGDAGEGLNGDGCGCGCG